MTDLTDAEISNLKKYLKLLQETNLIKMKRFLKFDRKKKISISINQRKRKAKTAVINQLQLDNVKCFKMPKMFILVIST